MALFENFIKISSFGIETAVRLLLQRCPLLLTIHHQIMAYFTQTAYLCLNIHKRTEYLGKRLPHLLYNLWKRLHDFFAVIIIMHK
jgi:hypothetical protein